MNLKDGETDVDAYFIFNALVFQFYFQLRIIIDLPLFKSTICFDIIRVELFGIHVEHHSLKRAKQEAFKKSKTFGLGFDVLSPEPEPKDIIVK